MSRNSRLTTARGRHRAAAPHPSPRFRRDFCLRFHHSGGRVAQYLAICLLLAFAGHLRAADSVRLDLNPKAVQVAPGEASQVILLVQNDGSSALSQVKLHWSSDLALTVTPQQSLPGIIAAHAAVALPVNVRRASQGRGVGTLSFWISWIGQPEAGSGAAVASLDVQDRSYLTIDKLATIRLESAVDHLDENQSAQLYVIVTNISSVPVTISGMQPFSPRFIRLILAGSDPKSDSCKTALLAAAPPPFKVSETVLQPQQSSTFPVIACVTDQAVAGSQRVVIEADLKWVENGAERTGSLSVAQTLPVTIFGESDLLKLVGVPSFLFLPGFLFLTSFHSLWKQVYPRTQAPAAVTASETALLSVSISFVSALVYPLMAHRSYLQGYGVRDVMNVWFGSIMAAIIAWCFVGGVRLLAVWIRRWRQHRAAEKARREHDERIRERTATKDDSALDMLRRMSLVGMEPPPEQATVSLDGARPAPCFIVMNPSADDPHCWVAPPILLSSKQPIARPQSRADVAALLLKPDVSGNFEQLYRVLFAASMAGWNVLWGESGAIIGPTPVAADVPVRGNRAQGFEFVQFSP